MKARCRSALSGSLFLSGMVLIVLAGPTRAQERPFPYTVSKRDMVILPVSLGISLLGDSEAAKYRAPLTMEEIALYKRSDVNRFDRSATSNWSWGWSEQSDDYRNGVIVAAIGIGMYETLRIRNLHDTATLGVMFLEAALLVKGTTYLTKALVGRKRPFVYNTTFSVEERYQKVIGDENDAFFSFFSGHSSSAFALAAFTSTVFSDIHGPSTWSRLVWGSTLTLATLTAYARVKAGVHYPTDVIVGAIVGGAIGHLVPVMHRNNSSQRLTLGVLPDRVCLYIRQ